MKMSAFAASMFILLGCVDETESLSSDLQLVRARVDHTLRRTMCLNPTVGRFTTIIRDLHTAHPLIEGESMRGGWTDPIPFCIYQCEPSFPEPPTCIEVCPHMFLSPFGPHPAGLILVDFELLESTTFAPDSAGEFCKSEYAVSVRELRGAGK